MTALAGLQECRKAQLRTAIRGLASPCGAALLLPMNPEWNPTP